MAAKIQLTQDHVNAIVNSMFQSINYSWESKLNFLTHNYEILTKKDIADLSELELKIIADCRQKKFQYIAPEIFNLYIKTICFHILMKDLKPIPETTPETTPTLTPKTTPTLTPHEEEIIY